MPKHSIIITLDGSDQDAEHLVQALGRAVDELPDTGQVIVGRREGDATAVLNDVPTLIEAVQEGTYYRFDGECPPDCRDCRIGPGYCEDHKRDRQIAANFKRSLRKLKALQS